MTNPEKPDLRDRPTAGAERPSERARVAGGAAPSPAAHAFPHKMRASGLTVRYGEKIGVKDVSIEVHEKQVLALIGPSGCGKSTFLRSLNRMNDTVPERVH